MDSRGHHDTVLTISADEMVTGDLPFHNSIDQSIGSLRNEPSYKLLRLCLRAEAWMLCWSRRLEELSVAF